MKNGSSSTNQPPQPRDLTREDTSKSRLLSALAWTSGANWGTQALSWATTLLVARILTPHDYGLFGMATLVIGVAGLVGELGIGTAVVTGGTKDAAALRQLNTVALLVGLGEFLVVAAAAPPLARFFRADELVPAVTVLGATLLVQSLKVLPEGLLAQAREFRLLAGVDSVRALLGVLATLLCAWLGWGYWSLVIGYASGVLGGTVATLLLRPVAFERPRRRVVAPVMRLGFEIVGSRLAWFCYSNADFLVAGRVLGTTALGVYTMAWTIATAPVDKIAATINRVSESFFAASRADLGALRWQFLRMTEGIALVTMPACCGLALVADDLIAGLLGPRWSDATLPLVLLCLSTPLRCLVVVVPSLLLVLGESRHLMVTMVGAAVLLPFCFLVGSAWGAAGIAAAWALAYPLVAFSLYLRSLPRIGVSTVEYARTVRPAIGATLWMALGVVLIRQVLPSQWPTGLRLALQIGTGIAVWAWALAQFNRSTALWLLRLTRQLVGGGSPASR